VTLTQILDAAMANKAARGFSLTDVPLEFCLLTAEVSEAFEAFEAWRHQDDVGPELADVVIFAAGLAGILEVDLQAAVEAKLAVNAARTYRALPNGCHVKDETDG
jgi:NTP pyrophosphatase (non-canonical NTP hydrolase)